jgi:hypothetical protein
LYYESADDEGNNTGKEADDDFAGTFIHHALVIYGLSMEEAEIFMQSHAKATSGHDWQEINHIGSTTNLVKALNKSQKKDYLVDPHTATKIKVLILWAKWS